MSRKNWDSVEGVVDVGPIVIAHCDTPGKASMVQFLHDVLTGKIPALIPLTTFLGAYHVLTKYLKIARQDVLLALEGTLDVDSPAFYESISAVEVQNALKIASISNVESWDGYLMNLARQFGTRVIYTIDTGLETEGFKLVVPITDDELHQYHEWVKRVRKEILKD